LSSRKSEESEIAQQNHRLIFSKAAGSHHLLKNGHGRRWKQKMNIVKTVLKIVASATIVIFCGYLSFMLLFVLLWEYGDLLPDIPVTSTFDPSQLILIFFCVFSFSVGAVPSTIWAIRLFRKTDHHENKTEELPTKASTLKNAPHF
jgi:hypothetical protein